MSCYKVVTINNPTNKYYTVLVFSNDILTYNFEGIRIQMLPLANKTQFLPFNGKNTHVLVYDFVEGKPVLYKRVNNRGESFNIGSDNTLPQSESDCATLVRWAENHTTPKVYSYVPGLPRARERIPIGNGLYYVPD